MQHVFQPPLPYKANDSAVVDARWRASLRLVSMISHRAAAATVQSTVHAACIKIIYIRIRLFQKHVSSPMNSSSSSSSSSPFSESICMASSMKLTAFPDLGAEFWSLPKEASLVSLSFSRVKYCNANSSRSLG